LAQLEGHFHPEATFEAAIPGKHLLLEVQQGMRSDRPLAQIRQNARFSVVIAGNAFHNSLDNAMLAVPDASFSTSRMRIQACMPGCLASWSLLRNVDAAVATPDFQDVASPIEFSREAMPIHHAIGSGKVAPDMPIAGPKLEIGTESIGQRNSDTAIAAVDRPIRRSDGLTC
jgi:hypothetical protein